MIINPFVYIPKSLLLDGTYSSTSSTSSPRAGAGAMGGAGAGAMGGAGVEMSLQVLWHWKS